MFKSRSSGRGFSLVEILITIAIFSLVFGGLFAAVNAMIILISNSKAKSSATAIAVERMEYVRSLSYDAVGTAGGVPSGLIPQNTTSTLNQTTFNERILVEYVDDPADGFGGADTNGILSDYKRVKVEISWSKRGATSSVSLVSTVVPPGIESTLGGGTIRVNVYDANTLPVVNAAVRFVNYTATTTIDTIRFTNLDGIAYLAGAPALANYEIYVSQTGYSNDQTYIATTTNPNPATPLVAVVESSVSTMNFIIDELSDLTIAAVGTPTFDSFADSFSDLTLVASSSNMFHTGSSVTLSGTPGSYAPSGILFATTTTPATLDSWYTLNFTATSSASTTALVQLYAEAAGVYTLVPDTELPGNSSGFTGGPVDIQAIDISTYPSLVPGVTLTSIDPDETPELYDWEIVHIASQAVLSGIDVSVRGDKSIGTNASSSPVYKFDNDYVTDGSGEVILTDIEFDFYSIALTGTTQKIIEVCPVVPYYLLPGTSERVQFTLGSLTGSFLRVVVTDPSGAPVANASARLENSGYDVTQTTNICGQTYFNSGGLYDDTEYMLTVSRAGYNSSNATTTVTSNSATDIIINSI